MWDNFILFKYFNFKKKVVFQYKIMFFLNNISNFIIFNVGMVCPFLSTPHEENLARRAT